MNKSLLTNIISCLILIIGYLSSSMPFFNFFTYYHFGLNNYGINRSNIFGLNWKVILGGGLDHVYSTWWYLGLLVIFGLCLLSCTFVQQFPTLKVARKVFFQTSLVQFKKQKLLSGSCLLRIFV